MARSKSTPPKSKRSKSTPIEPATPARKQPAPGTGAAAAGQSGDIQGLPAAAAPVPGAAAGQSGDIQGLPGREDVENEGVRELQEEGQFFEASVVDGVENTSFAEEGEVRVHKRPEDDLRPEYTDQDPDEPKE